MDEAAVRVALMRGMNVGGRNLIAMSDLVAIFRDSGCNDVRTYIQSGNVLFRSEAALASRIPTLVSEAIAARFGLTVPVLLRTSADLDQVTRRNPFVATGTDPKFLHVAFLMGAASKAGIAALDPDRSPPDEFFVRGREIYLHCPNGVGKSKLSTQYFDSKLGTTSTMRNWNTVLKLGDLARQVG
jgi:uncharacterized protein (DUF1697 family)